MYITFSYIKYKLSCKLSFDKMKKILIALIFPLFSACTSAPSIDTYLPSTADHYTATKSWQYSPFKEWAISPEVYDDNDGSNTYAVAYSTVGGGVNVGIYTTLSTCKQFSENTTSYGVLTYNGQAIRTSKQCMGMKRGIIFPTSNKGIEFVINEFEDENRVVVREIKSFYTKNFSKMVKLVKQQAKKNLAL